LPLPGRVSGASSSLRLQVEVVAIPAPTCRLFVGAHLPRVVTRGCVGTQLTVARTSALGGSTPSCLFSSSQPSVRARPPRRHTLRCCSRPAAAYLGGGLLYNVRRLGLPLEKESLPHYVFWTEMLPELVKEVVAGTQTHFIVDVTAAQSRHRASRSPFSPPGVYLLSSCAVDTTNCRRPPPSAASARATPCSPASQCAGLLAASADSIACLFSALHAFCRHLKSFALASRAIIKRRAGKWPAMRQ
jgi:hypothetical protein